MATTTDLRKPTTWTDFSYLRRIGREPDGRRINKKEFSQLLSRSGLPQPTLIDSFACAGNISLVKAPDYFVLKPVSLYSSLGVMLLHRVSGTTLFYDAMSKAVMREQDIIEKQHEISERFEGRKIKYMLEERVLDEDSNIVIPYDYKVFVFLGSIKFILQVDRNHPTPKVNFFDGSFKEISDGRVYIPSRQGINKALGVARVPKAHSEILEFARSMSEALADPFLSIDFYSSISGARFGELTRTPGGPWFGRMYRFSESFDEELGRAWEASCKTLGKEVPLVETSFEIARQGKTYRRIERS